MSSTSPDRHSISFDLVGIGELLESRELSVPQYQRSYSWNVSGERQIDEYWDDLERVAATNEEYFLGTVVLSRSSDSNRRTIIDGQQRLATTSMLLAAIRNQLSALGSEKAGVVERDFLAKETIKSSGKERRLKLNIEDDDYFDTLIVADAGRSPDPKVPSQGRMKQAFDFLSGKIEMLAKRYGVSGLLEWTEFLHDRAKIGVIEVSTEADAYIIFETLNDRGAALTAADLLKNYLYGRSGDRLKYTQHHWARTLGTLELTAADAKFMTYLRHFWSSKQGLTREKDLYGKIKASIATESEVSNFAVQLEHEAVKYAALTNPEHELWKGYDPATRNNMEVLIELNLLPNRPLLLAAIEKFEPKEIRSLSARLVNWSVRALTLGTINSGKIEDVYCNVARSIRNEEIATTRGVYDNIIDVIAGDAEFEAEFAIARVTKTSLARYYLRSLEKHSLGKEPENVPNPNPDEVNLEHVLPRNAKSEEWAGIANSGDVAAWTHRIGNMVLLQKGPNSRLGNKPFSEKRTVLANSAFALTAEVAREEDWGPDEIDRRQRRLAKLAIATWPR